MKNNDRASRIAPPALAVCLALLLLIMLACACNKGGGGSQPAGANTASQQDSSSSSMNLNEPQVEKDYSALAKEIRSLIAPYGGEVAVEFISLQPEGGSFSINGDKAMLSASMLKIPILAGLLDGITKGDISLDDVCIVQASDVVGGTGTGLEAGQELTVEQLARLMIAESDNTASNTLIDLLGKSQLNSYFQNIGLEETVLDHDFMARNPGGDNLTSARDLAKLFKIIATDGSFTAKLCDLAEGMLLDQSDKDAMVGGLQADMKLGHKTGSLSSARHDGGIIYSAEGEPLCVLVILTQGVDESSANKLIAQVTKTVCESL